MGLKPSSQVAKDLAKSKEIDQAIQKDAEHCKSLIKLLLLGPGESGKSTVLKQIRILHDTGFSDSEVFSQRSIIRGNLLQCMVSLLQGMEDLSIPLYEPSLNQDAKLVLAEHRGEDCGVESISLAVSEAIQRLWADKNLKRVLSMSHNFQLIDSAMYFLMNVKRICAEDYLPSQQDVLMSRRPTTAIVEYLFDLKGKPFLIIDVGGQRNHRRKWIHCFENVNSILYIAAISEYNQTLREMQTMNRLVDAIRLFGALANSKWFKKTHMILFFNKIDLFSDKISKCPITTAFPHYIGPQEYDACIAYIEEQFQRKNSSRTRNVYCHQTCATDTSQITHVLDSTIDMISSHALTCAGMY